MNKKILAALAAICFLVLCAVPAMAEVYVKQKMHTDPVTVMGKTQPEKNETMVFWLGKDRSRTDTDDRTSMIFLGDKKIILMLDHEKKTYAEMPFDWQNAISENMEKEGKSEEAKQVSKLLGGLTKSLMKFEAKVTPTAETKKIKDWNCRKYLVNTKMSVGSTNSEMWATEDLRIDPVFYWTSVYAQMASQQGFQEIIKEMQKIKGVVVYSETTGKAMGSEVKSTTELLEFGDKTAPAGAYDIPAGYTKVKSIGRK